VRETADAISEELRIWSDFADEGARALANDGDFEGAWNEMMRAESLGILRANLSNDRADAPLYRDRPDSWDETLRAIISETFPLAVSTSSSLYVWECSESDCDSDEF
jgi:hypothetical protein